MMRTELRVVAALAVLLLLQAAAAAAQQCSAGCGAGCQQRGPPLPDLPDALTAVHDKVRSRAADDQLVSVAEILFKSYRNTSDVLAPTAATPALEALALAAAAAEGAPYRGAILLERGKLLEVVVRPEAAQAALELAVALLQKQALPLVQGVDYAAAAEAISRQDDYTTSMQRWVMARLLESARLLHELGQEERVHQILAPLPGIAAALREPGSYISSIGQLNKLTDEQLEEVLSCTARLEKYPDPKPRRNATAAGAAAAAATGAGAGAAANATDAAEAAGAAAGAAAAADAAEAAAEAAAAGQGEEEEEEEEEPGAPCSWLKGVRQQRGSPLYYTLHRALHSRKRYNEAWAALTTAKRLSGPGPEWEDDDYEAMLEDLAAIFPDEDEEVDGETDADEFEKDADEASDAAGAKAAGRGALAAPQPPGPLRRAAEAVARGVGAARAWLRGLLGRALGGRQLAAPAVPPEPRRYAHLSEMHPIFVTGLPRSGSTLIEQILSSHPDAWGAGEHTRLPPVVNQLLDDIAENGAVSVARLKELRLRYIDGMRDLMPPEALNATWLVDKNLGNAWHIGHIALMMPEACILHAVRHPADTSLSSFQQSFRPSSIPWSFNLTHLADHVEAHHAVMGHWSRALRGRVLDVHYSQMVGDMEGTTRKILEHCGLSWHPNMLRFYETKRFVYTASLLQVRRPIYTTSVGKWQVYKEGLAPLLLSLRETILAYETASGLPSSVAVLDELAAQRKAAVAAARAATAEREAAAAAVVAAVASEAGAGGAGAEQAAVPQVVAEPVSGQPACSAGADGGAAAGSCSAAGMAVD
ncbi:TPR domain [Micractinium conductrix]|uniref:protein-tyrosine sulfotransferase n=1 Tax=Micractinium conductrix TaxID=554055 RepID=A0A2P6UZP8_9CHLO|nr:TPR domain [Micractinium conductrix]|eukprot:PSC67312.1 TPR domain [Micractinium conductrix]